MYTPCSKKKKEYTWEVWLIQSTECIILMYIPHRIPDHVCITANELLLTLPIDLQQTSELLLEHNQQEGKSCRFVSFWFVFAMSTILTTYDLLQQRWSILLFIHEESFMSVKTVRYEKSICTRHFRMLEQETGGEEVGGGDERKNLREIWERSNASGVL